MGDFMQLGARKPRTKIRFFLVLLIAGVIAAGFWLALRRGPTPVVELATDRPAVGKATTVTATFSEPVHGLGGIRLELIQGDRVEVLDRRELTRGSLVPWSRADGTAEVALTAVVGTTTLDWLDDGDVILRATADRSVGFLRRDESVVAERVLPVRRRPPRLELESSQHYGQQGGSGAVRYRAGETAVRSGVRAGTHESLGLPLPGGGSDEFFTIYALPWDLGDPAEVRLFAEDDAGNRVEAPFLDLFKALPARVDTIRLDDAFFERVVPAIASRTPGFDDSGTLLEQYLLINRELRRAELDRVAELSRRSEPAFLWSGPFFQMTNSALKANFAQTRSYLYDGREVDRQTHLGLDLASTARAPVPAPNSGRVVFAGWMTLYGNAIIIDHGYGLMSLCGHLSTIETAEGDQVERGEIIGRSGATGLAGGDHLHLEIFVHGQSVDPLEWLDGKWIQEKIMAKIGR
jgi:murein DD-endopeptidase MepM/ murein hydrolase activator NlpD